MKKSLLLLVLLCGCAGSKPATADTKSSVNIILSSDSKTRAIINDNLPLRCAFIKEWDVSTIRDDKRKEGCWCMYPPFVGPSSGLLITFRYMEDNFCTGEEKKLPEKSDEEMKL